MEQDVMYVDERNAEARSIFGRPMQRPRRTVFVPPSRSPTVVYAPGTGPATGAGTWTAYPNPAQMPTTPYNPMGTFAAKFGLTMGELIDSALQILAALAGLPNAPTAQGDAEVDTENLILYQSALAKHAKRDEQLRTVGNLLVRILK